MVIIFSLELSKWKSKTKTLGFQSLKHKS